MKLKKYIYGAALGALTLTYASCYNADREFPDFEGGTTAYFPYQNPVRTLILGNDTWDNTLDNAHKCRIYATMGGAYNGRNAVINFVVADSLCNNLYFTDAGGNAGNEVKPMPASYYKLASNSIPFNGDVRGYVEVQLTDEFFNDPKSAENTYVIPLLMTSVQGLDQILKGRTREGLTPQRVNADDWEVLPMDYTLYCVKYMNPWQARYIRRGVDNVTENTTTKEIIRKDFSLVNSDPGRYKENPVNANDEVCSIKTKNMTQAIFPVSIGRAVAGQASVACNLILTFDGNKCTITSEDEFVTASGTGEFITNGTKLPEYKDYQWGSINEKPVDRDILRLAYNVKIQKGKVIGKNDQGKDIVLPNDMDVVSTDTLVVQTRESNKKVEFATKYVIK